MNSAQLKQYIANGNLDAVFTDLYGSDKVAYQRERYSEAIDAFVANYTDSDDIRLFSVPGRSEISGNHTDHNHGKVLAASINLDIIAVARKTDTGVVNITSKGFSPDSVKISEIKVDPDKFFTSYAVIEGMCEGLESAGHTIGGFDAYTTSDVLKGSGLSSSAAFEVMVGNIMRTLYGNDVDDVTIAKLAQYSENKYFGKPCGLMDQTACAVGGFISIDFADPKNPIVGKPAFDLSALGYSLCIVNTGGNHADLNADYASVPAEMKAVAAHFGKEVLREVTLDEIIAAIPALREKTGDRAIMRAIHFVNENARVTKQAEALANGDLSAFFDGVRASGNSSFKFLQNVYTVKNVEEQGLSLALAVTEDFLAKLDAPSACRVHGGGFAGTIQAFMPESATADYARLMDGVFGEGATYILRIRNKGAVCVY
ncbi:MAG: galactokinase [Ruminococcaceae bacterium]|nr:galactokinase [Oscillospiraceae bacterium]